MSPISPSPVLLISLKFLKRKNKRKMMYYYVPGDLMGWTGSELYARIKSVKYARKE